MSLLFLTGLPGSGKTTVGKKLAEALNLPFIDLDDYIESNIKRTIADIFQREGEHSFRKIEQEQFATLVKTLEHGVVATGGGSLCSDQNLKQAKSIGTVVYLKVKPSTVAERQSSSGLRPIIKNTSNLISITKELELLLESRRPFYERAHHVIDAENLVPSQTVTVICELVDHSK